MENCRDLKTLHSVHPIKYFKCNGHKIAFLSITNGGLSNFSRRIYANKKSVKTSKDLGFQKIVQDRRRSNAKGPHFFWTWANNVQKQIELKAKVVQTAAVDNSILISCNANKMQSNRRQTLKKPAANATPLYCRHHQSVWDDPVKLLSFGDVLSAPSAELPLDWNHLESSTLKSSKQFIKHNWKPTIDAASIVYDLCKSIVRLCKLSISVGVWIDWCWISLENGSPQSVQHVWLARCAAGAHWPNSSRACAVLFMRSHCAY